MANYRRYRLAGGTYFFTLVTADRGQLLLAEHIDALRAAFREVKERHPFTLEAVVILPDHLHCVCSLPQGDDDFSMRWRQIKSAFSRRVTGGEARSPSRMAKGERGLWQRRFWEHAMRDESDYQRHVNYVHYNPVKHGHVRRVRDWPYSSFHRFVVWGMYPREWGGEGVDETLELE